MEMFNAPVPGESLTDEPRNYPWENPPELATVNETLDFYMDKLTQPDVIDNLLLMLESKMPVDSIAKSLTMTGVMQGKHSLDVQLLVLPPIHKYLTMIGKKANIKYIDKFSPDPTERKRQKETIFTNAMLNNAIDEMEKMPEEKKDEGDVIMEQTLEALEEGEVTEQPEEPQAEEQQTQPDEKPRGLMSREGM